MRVKVIINIYLTPKNKNYEDNNNNLYLLNN